MESATFMPKSPKFSNEEIEKCKRTGDYNPILFEWYKFVAQLNAVVAHIQRDSPAFKSVRSLHYHVLAGLMNRCARLMLANVELSHKGLFGETTAIVDRCIFESAMKIIWLCQTLEHDRFVRYLADGLKTEIEFKTQIESNVAARGGETLPIERRMLKSIANHIAASGLSESEVISAKKLPDMAAMLATIGYNRLMYVTAHRLGSHHIHGTWSSLLIHYLEEEVGKPEFNFRPRGHDCETNFNQFAFVPLMVLQALSEYVQFALDEPEARAFVELFKGTESELIRLYEEAGAADDRRRDGTSAKTDKRL